MIPFILGGVALAVTGYGVKKYLEDESNCKELEDTVCSWIDEVENKTDKFFDYANCIRRPHSDSQPINIRTLSRS